jgi:soluble calcium-activated nucleotidase 1
VKTHVDWRRQYTALRAAAGARYPGYLVHEAGIWSAIHRRWFFLPRRVSSEPYDEQQDELRGSNTVLVASEDFRDVRVLRIGPVSGGGARGFSSAKFVPSTNDHVIVALKSEEDDKAGTQQSYVTVFDLAGNVLMEEQRVPGVEGREGGVKFEGIELLETKMLSSLSR